MTARAMPGLGLMADWDLGEDNWKDGMDENILWSSVLLGSRVDDLVALEPTSPSEGAIVILNASHATHANAIAAYDEAAWHYLPVPEGTRMFNAASGDFLERSATGWEVVSAATVAYVDAAVAAVSGNGGATLNGVVSGCTPTYSGASLTFDLSAGSYYVDGALHTAAAQSVTLNAADGSNPRIDVLYLDDTGTFGKITGTAAASPSQPAIDPTSQLYLTFVLVPAAATDLNTGITSTDIYKEGAEWAATSSGAGLTLNSTNSPYAGTKCIEGTAVATDAYVKFVTSSFSFAGDGNLTLRIKSKGSWNAKRGLTLQWYSGGVAVGTAVTLKSGTFGFDSSNTTGYQLVAIAKNLFAVPGNATELRVTAVGSGGAAIGFYLDNLILQSTGTTTGGTATSSGLTQDQADARYTQRANNLSDLPDKAAARSNLGVGVRPISCFFTTAPTASEKLMIFVACQAITLADDFVGSTCSVGTNPAATFALDVKKNGASVGTITISTAGAVTFVTSGTTVSLAVGDRLSITAPATADASIADVAISLKGIV